MPMATMPESTEERTEEGMRNYTVTRERIGDATELGAVAAMIISWSLNKSLFWMLVHGICGWFYLIYWGIWL